MARKRSPFSLYERNGVWYARAWDETAQRYTSGKSTGETRKMAAAVEAQKMVDRGDFAIIGQNTALADYLREFWSSTKRGWSAGYQAQSLEYVETISKWPGARTIKIRSLTTPHLNRLSDWLATESDLSARSAARAFQVVTVALNHAAKTGRIGSNIARDAEKPRSKGRERGVLDLDEIAAIIALDFDTRKKAIVLLGALAGLRRGEVRALKWQAIDFERGTIRVELNYVNGEGFKPPKADSYRTVPMVGPLSDCLTALRAASPYTAPDDLAVYNADRGQPVAMITCRRAFFEILAAIGIDAEARERRHLVFHGLRHFFASMSRDSGLSDFATSRLTGQRSRAVLEGYSNPSVIQLDEARQKLDARFRRSG